MSSRLGIIAGRGGLPARVAGAAEAAGRQVFLVAIEGELGRLSLPRGPDAVVNLAQVGQVLDCLRRAGCGEICLAGPIARPDFQALRPDWRGLKLLPRVVQAARLGDDALLRTLIDFFEQEGFAVVGAHQVATDLLMPAGALGARAPTVAERADIDRGGAVVRALGTLDVGQAAVVVDGLVLAVEAAEGTDRMLARAAELKRPKAPGGVLVKAPKPGQDLRVDLPTIGPDTVAAARAAGLAGIAAAAGAAILMDRPETAAGADEAGLFLWGFDHGPGA